MTEAVAAAKRSRLVRVVRTLGGFAGGALAAALFYFMGLDARSVARHIVAAPVWAVLACTASGFVLLALQSLRWHLVMRPLLGLRYGEALRAQTVGAMFNILLPARAGDLLRVQYLGRRTGESRPTILGTEVVDRWLDWWGWLPVIGVLAVTSQLPRWIYTAFALLGALLAAWAVTMVVVGRSGRAPREGSRFAAVLSSFRLGVESFRSRRTLVLALAVAPLPWLFEALALEVTGRAFGIDLSYTMAFCVLIGFNIGMVVPSPGAIGSLETGGTAVLSYFGVDPSAGLAFVTVYHFAQLLPTVLAGVAILVAQGELLFFGKGAARGSPAET